MSYAIKEMILTRQGEGFYTGRKAIFLRFSGCNLWSGRDQDRARAICSFCDTDFIGTDGENGDHYASPEQVLEFAQKLWRLNRIKDLSDHEFGSEASHEKDDQPFIVCTGGEPLLQLNPLLIETLKEGGFEIAVETNGTRRIPAGFDWVCVSPKAGSRLLVNEGDELKLVYPQEGMMPEDLSDMNFQRYYLQPMDGPLQEENIAKAKAFIEKNPKWRLSLQYQKLWAIK